VDRAGRTTRRAAGPTLALLLALATADFADGQFFEGFDAPEVVVDPSVR